MYVSYTYLLLEIFSAAVSGLTLPMTKPSGEPDMASVISHVTLLEHTVAALQTEVRVATGELTTVKSKLQETENKLQETDKKLQATETRLQMTEFKLKTAEDKLQIGVNDCAMLKTNQQTTAVELSRVKGDLSSAERNITYLMSDLQKRPDQSEFTNMKSELEDLKVSQNALRKMVNCTVDSVISTGVNSNTKDIKNLKSQLHTAHRDFTQMIQEVESRQRDHERNLATTKSSLQSTDTDVRRVETKLNTISERVTGLSQQVSSPHNDVAFQVTQSQTGVSDGWKELSFDSTDLTIGGGYNNRTGVFTAPVSGTYIFWADVALRGFHGDHEISIYQKRRRLARGYVSVQDEGDDGVASAMTVTYLDKGDHIHFAVESKRSYIYGDGWSSYGGALIQSN